MRLLPPLLILTGAAIAQQEVATTIDWANDPFTQLSDFIGTPLSAGMGGVFGEGDGAALRLGYFDLATLSNPFIGNWIVLTGGSIGDKGDLGDGRFELSRSSPDFVPDALLPAEGTPLAIRFYDAVLPAGAPEFFNTVANEQGQWNWKTPSAGGARVVIRLSDAGLVWEGGAASAYRTTIPLPEPSALLLVAVGASVAMARRR